MSTEFSNTACIKTHGINFNGRYEICRQAENLIKGMVLTQMAKQLRKCGKRYVHFIIPVYYSYFYVRNIFMGVEKHIYGSSPMIVQCDLWQKWLSKFYNILQYKAQLMHKLGLKVWFTNCNIWVQNFSIQRVSKLMVEILTEDMRYVDKHKAF